jgi:SAM-dependent methyltransferase
MRSGCLAALVSVTCLSGRLDPAGSSELGNLTPLATASDWGRCLLFLHSTGADIALCQRAKATASGPLPMSRRSRETWIFGCWIESPRSTGTESRAADLGCGTGRTVAWLKSRGVQQVNGVDLTQEMLEVARARDVYSHLALADVSASGLESAAYSLVTNPPER